MKLQGGGMGAAKSEGQISWPRGLEWPVNTAWQAQMLAKVVLGIETTGIETDKKAIAIAKKLHARNLSYSPNQVPSDKRKENFIMQRDRVLAAGGALLALSEKDSRLAFARLQARVNDAYGEEFDEAYDIGARNSAILLTPVIPLVEYALKEGLTSAESRPVEAIAA